MLNKVVKDKIYTLLSSFDFDCVFKENPVEVAKVLSDSVTVRRITCCQGCEERYLH